MSGSMEGLLIPGVFLSTGVFGVVVKIPDHHSPYNRCQEDRQQGDAAHSLAIHVVLLTEALPVL